MGNVAAWFEPSLETLAIYLYVRRLLGQARVSNIANQVRGLGILGFDPEPLEPWVETVLARSEREPVWRGRVIADAEDRLTESDLQKITAILPIRSPAELWIGPGGRDTGGYLRAGPTAARWHARIRA